MGLTPRKRLTHEQWEREQRNIADLRDYVLPEDQDDKKRAEDEAARIEKNFLEVVEAFENASKHPTPKYPTAGTAEALAYWGDLARRKIQNGGGAYNIAMTRAAACALKLGRVNEHPEWLSTTQKTNKVNFINIEALEKCFAAYSPCVSAAAKYIGQSDTPQSVVFEGKRCCNNHFLCAFDAQKFAGESQETAGLISRYALEAGYRAIMGAVTLPHWYGKNDVESVAGLGECWRRVVKSRRWRRLEEKYGISDLGVIKDIPYIRGFEQIIGGKNGGHYHFHFLMWYKGRYKDADEIISVLRALWIEFAVEHLHLVPGPDEDPMEYEAFLNHGFQASRVNRRKTSKAVDYVTKLNSWKGKAKEWGALSEITRSDLKKGRGDGLTAPALLAKIAMIDAPYYRQTRDPEAWAVLIQDVETYCRFAGATRGRVPFDTSNGLKTWAEAQRRREDTTTESKETLFGFHAVDWSYLVNHGLIQEIKKAVMTGPECVARMLDYFENDLHIEIWTPAQIAQLRANEEIKAAEYRYFRKQKAKLQKDFRAAAADPSVTLKTAFQVLSAWEYREFLRVRGEILAPPAPDILLLPAPPAEIGLFDNLCVKNDAAGG